MTAKRRCNRSMTLAEWVRAYGGLAPEYPSEDRELNVRSIMQDRQREVLMLLTAERHAAMRDRTREEVRAIYAQMRANGAMIPVAEWEKSHEAQAKPSESPRLPPSR